MQIKIYIDHTPEMGLPVDHAFQNGCKLLILDKQFNVSNIQFSNGANVVCRPTLLTAAQHVHCDGSKKFLSILVEGKLPESNEILIGPGHFSVTSQPATCTHGSCIVDDQGVVFTLSK